MATTVYVGLILVVVASFANAQRDRCNPHNPYQHRCTSDHQRHHSYQDMATQLKEARDMEHIPDFLVNMTIGMHQYLHPCHNYRDAVLFLFYDVHVSVSGSGPLVGRRKREDPHYNSETALLHTLLDQIRHDTGAEGACILHLINMYKGDAGRQFRAHHHNYYVPTTPAPTTTLPPTTLPPTTQPPTTQPPTTQPPTTQPPTTQPPTTQPPTTAQPTTPPLPPTTTLPPGRCTTCAMLDCLLASHVTDCSAGQPFCVTSVRDVNGGREITRACADQAKCDSIQRVTDCDNIETNTLSAGITCEFCCRGDNCNKPPQLIPASSTLYKSP